MFSCADAKCAISPTVMSEKSEWRSLDPELYPPSFALTDNVGTWYGRFRSDATFLIDLGHEATVTEIHLRNAALTPNGNPCQ